MKKLTVFLLLFSICLSFSGCNRKLMWRHQMTKLPETSTASSTEAPQIVEEISQGKVNIKGCTVKISHVFFTYADQDNVTYKACAVLIDVINRSGNPVKFNSLCQVRVKQDGKRCGYIDSPQGYDFDLDAPIDAFGMYMLFYKVTSFNKPVQIEILYQGMVVTEFTYEQ